jgi:hypothetical protein
MYVLTRNRCTLNLGIVLLLILWLSASGTAFAQKKKNQPAAQPIQATVAHAPLPEPVKAPDALSNGSVLLVFVDNTSDASRTALGSLKQFGPLKIKPVTDGLFVISSQENKDLVGRLRAAYPELVFLTPAQFETIGGLSQKDPQLFKTEGLLKYAE